MSAPSAEAPLADAQRADTPAQRADAPARSLSVFLIALGLASVGLVVAFLFRSDVGSIDARAELERLFEPFEIPHGLTLDRAVQFPQGVRAVVFVDLAAEPEPPAAPTPTTEAPADSSAPRFDWTKVAIGASGKPPRRVTLTSDPDREGVELGRGMVGPGGPGALNIKTLGPEGGIVAIEIGKIPWREFNADFFHERSYERGGTFQDSIRVNLSANGRACTLSAQWTRGVGGSRAQVEEILARLTPRPRIE